ncbi:hypothetical protein QW180_07805 [Vibrio sinaloensis]|nr:hypothetical protein [Vibrio sinaloensis]
MKILATSPPKMAIGGGIFLITLLLLGLLANKSHAALERFCE